MVLRLVLVCIAFLQQSGGNNFQGGRACLALESQAEEGSSEDLCATGFKVNPREKEKKTSQAALAGSCKAPQLEPSRDTPPSSFSCHHDLVLQTMRSTEQPELREVSLLQSALERCMGGPEKEGPEPKQDPKIQRRDTGRSEGGGELAGFPGEGPLDYVNSCKDLHVSSRNVIQCQGQ